MRELEELAAYDKRLKRERFTREMLIRYAKELGVDPFNDDFFTVSPETPAIWLERPERKFESPSFTLEEVVEGKPWFVDGKPWVKSG